ncbi:Cell wall-active antibiotics response 4TMS YvqF [Amycolatopsis pretoriensis]|uniref:Cell wall-active antibiotics response 4TMS YvqF n=2 Tax=Amycolatopsis pretoriensis TaxID=218821 RepID=A0A1H5RBZ3_9PSEU|nr:Cell wall-active antibiotics response 4TMS YvqF [Amycolatopsis pretoriensis]
MVIAAKLRRVSELTPDQMRASDADRERVAQVLHNALSEGRITVNELEERLSTVYAAKTIGELKPVTADLPTSSAALEPAPTRALGFPDQRIGGHPGSPVSIGVMSGAVRKGSWVLPPQHTSFAFWGGAEIDLRQARFADRQCTITAVAIMGGITITVPDDINVDVTGIGFMGGFVLEDKSGAPPAPPTAPTVKINGLGFWGGVVVYRRPAQRAEPPQIEGA